MMHYDPAGSEYMDLGSSTVLLFCTKQERGNHIWLILRFVKSAKKPSKP